MKIIKYFLCEEKNFQYAEKNDKIRLGFLFAHCLASVTSNWPKMIINLNIIFSYNYGIYRLPSFYKIRGVI